MALKKIKLPDNSVVDVQDSRIPATAASDNGKVLGVTNTSGTLGWVEGVDTYEANLLWGGKNLVNSYSPIDAAMIGGLGACRSMFAKAEGIAIEYSTNSGSTWSDYGANDSQKVGLFSDGSTWFTIGKNSTAGASSVSHMLRVTLSANEAQIYTVLNKFAICVSTNGSTGCYCTIRGRYKSDYDSDADVWTTFADRASVNGWPGYNIINTENITTGGGYWAQLQFIFGITAADSNYTGLCVTKIFCFGGAGWSCPSNMAYSGHLYSWDSSQNAIFPANITSTGFKVPNGTSSQFLKADGSLDGSSYALTSSVHDIPSGGTQGQVLKKNSATDYDASWADESGGVTDVQVGGTSVVSSGVASIQTESVSSVDLETPVETSYPSGGFRSNKIYDLGSQTGTLTYALYTTSLDTTIKNEWVWSFVTGSTAPTITWPSGITWDGGSAPTVNAGCIYEISVRLIGSYYVGYYKEIEL